MLPLGSALGAQFWNEEVQSTSSLDASVRSLPREPPPVSLIRNTKVSRSQQLLLLQRLYGIPFAPSIASDGLVLDRVIASTGGLNWWTTLTGRIRAQQLFRRGSNKVDGVPKWQECVKAALTKSMYALGMRARFLLGPNTSFNVKAEADHLDWDSKGSDRPWRVHSKFLHRLKNHDVSVEASLNERFIDRDSRYWDVPQALSMDIASVGSTSGLYYRLGLHHSSGVSPPQDKESSAAVAVPWGALPGTCAQAALSYGREFELWREDQPYFGRQLQKPYNLLAASPHITLSAVVGGVVNATLGQRTQQANASPSQQQQQQCKNDFQAAISGDAFGSLGLTAQFGLFQRFLLDHTKLGACLDFGSASKLPMNQHPVQHRLQQQQGVTFALSLQQQLLGPVRARIDSRFSLDSDLCKAPNMQEITYGLDCTLESLGAAKLVVWYSPTRSEGMAGIRILER